MSKANMIAWLMILSLGLYTAYCSYTPSVEALLGPDVDKNGIRDDVDEWINENTQNKYVKLAYQELARTDRDLFKYLDNKKKAIETVHLGDSAVICLVDIIGYLERSVREDGNLLIQLERPYRKKIQERRARLRREGHSYEEINKLTKVESERVNAKLNELRLKYGHLEKKAFASVKKWDQHRGEFFDVLDGWLNRRKVKGRMLAKYFNGRARGGSGVKFSGCNFEVSEKDLR